MNSSTSIGHLAINAWAPCPAAPPTDALQQSRQLQVDIREACDQDCGVIRLFVTPDMPCAELDQRLAAS